MPCQNIHFSKNSKTLKKEYDDMIYYIAEMEALV
jgi:hypothetical protein